MGSVLVKHNNNIIKHNNDIMVHGYKFNHLDYIYKHEADANFFKLQFHYGKQYRLHHDGLLPHNLFWDYLRVKHDLHHRRFDHYHPIVGRWIEEEPHIVPPPPNVPEPNSAILLSIVIICACLIKGKYARLSN